MAREWVTSWKMLTLMGQLAWVLEDQDESSPWASTGSMSVLVWNQMTNHLSEKGKFLTGVKFWSGASGSLD
jgi:hypothetical protein